MLILHVIGMPESSFPPGLPGATDHSEVLASFGLLSERAYKAMSPDFVLLTRGKTFRPS